MCVRTHLWWRCGNVCFTRMTKFNKETATAPRPTHTHGQTKGVKQIKRQTEGEPRDTCTGGVYGQLYRRASEESMILKALHGVTVTSAVASLPSQSTQPTCCCWRRVAVQAAPVCSRVCIGTAYSHAAASDLGGGAWEWHRKSWQKRRRPAVTRRNEASLAGMEPIADSPS